MHNPLLDKPRITLPFLHLLGVGVGLLSLANIINYSLGAPFWTITRLIHLGSDSNIPAWYSSGLLAVAGVVALDCFHLAKARGIAGAWSFACVAAALCLMSCDEIARLHEILGGQAAQLIGIADHSVGQHAGWVWIGGPLIMGLFGTFIFLLRKPLSSVGGSGRLLTFGFGFILLGGVVLESTINWLNHDELQWLWNIEIVVEETLEMLGSLLLAYAFTVWHTTMYTRSSTLSSASA